MKIIYHDQYIPTIKIKELIKEIRTITHKECEVNNMKANILRIADRLEEIIKDQVITKREPQDVEVPRSYYRFREHLRKIIKWNTSYVYL